MNDINWNDVLESLVQPPVDSYANGISRRNELPKDFQDILQIQEDANFNKNAIQWLNYYPEDHFDIEIEDRVAKMLNLNKYRSWISRINPGYFAAWHWDVDEHIEEYLRKGYPTRYSICITEKPESGHIFILRGNSGDVHYIASPQGTIIKWDDYKNWHTGLNAGLTPKYMYNFLGY